MGVLIKMPQDQNGNDLATSVATSSVDQQVTEKQNRINRNLAKFLSTEKQQQQLLLCLRQQQLPQQQQIRLGALTSMTVAYGHEAYLDHAVELLDPDLKPVPPQPNCPESMQVYEDHRLMAADYLAMQKELDDMIKYKTDLEDKLRQSESQMDEMASKSDNEQVKKFVQLHKEKDSLVQFQDKLSAQLQMIKKAQNPSSSQEQQVDKNLDEDWVLVHSDSKASGGDKC